MTSLWLVLSWLSSHWGLALKGLLIAWMVASALAGIWLILIAKKETQPKVKAAGFDSKRVG